VKQPENLDKKTLRDYCKNIGIKIAKKDEKDEFLITEFGLNAMKSGIVIQHNYGGATINLFNKNKELDDLKGIDTDSIPDEVIYFKPRNTLDSFLAQEPIYKNIVSKPALKNNPQFDYKTSFVIGTLYNLKNEKTDLDLQKYIKDLLEPLEPILGNKLSDSLINNFDSKKYLQSLSGNNDNAKILWGNLEKYSEEYNNKNQYKVVLDKDMSSVNSNIIDYLDNIRESRNYKPKYDEEQSNESSKKNSNSIDFENDWLITEPKLINDKAKNIVGTIKPYLNIESDENSKKQEVKREFVKDLSARSSQQLSKQGKQQQEQGKSK
jgi:hypothetical protein